MMARRAWVAVFVIATVPAAWTQRGRFAPAADDPGPNAEFHFLRLEYVDHPSARRGFRGFGGGRGWWMQDWPAAEIHFAQGIRRMTRIDIGNGRHTPLTDDRVFDYPWIYATQTGYWDLSEPEVTRLRKFLLKGGFLVTDDFHGPTDWDSFRNSMARVLPDAPILDIAADDQLMHILFDINERTQIPGLRHLRRGASGGIDVQMQFVPPAWRALHDPRGRMVVAVNFNMDIGDAWEHADMVEYPMEMTALAYRFGINYILYAMTH